ncbi:hypothetical protein C8R43DRAFT_1024639 [Mycena crocata]|nr:hypothetical protein C8R43DRAFT_1024639 [Mycena crocata]
MSAPVPDLGHTYGAVLIGVFVAVFFQGMLTVQAYIYYESFPDDSNKLKTFVALLWCLDFAHLFLVCQVVYHFLVDSWGDVAALAVTYEPMALHVVFVGAATILCQGFFLYRIWTFSHGNWYLVGGVAIPCLITFALDVYITAMSSGSHSLAVCNDLRGAVLAVFALAAGTDVILALLLVWYLARGMAPGRQSTFVVARVIQYTVATGLASSTLALAGVAAYVIRPDSFVSIAMHFSLGRMYTNSLFAMLNSRRNLRAALGSVEVSDASTGASWRDGMEFRAAPSQVRVVGRGAEDDEELFHSQDRAEKGKIFGGEAGDLPQPTGVPIK